MQSTPSSSGGPPQRCRARSAPLGAVILAAGRSTRMAPNNKLLAPWHGAPVVRHAARAALTAGLDPVVAVTGHDAVAVAEALAGLALNLHHNPAYGDGLSTSVKAGIGVLPGHVAGAVILLGDMPGITANMVRALADAFYADGGAPIVQPRHDDRPGNPVLWPRRLFGAFAELSGDRGAKPLLTRHADQIRSVAVDSPAIHMDIDTPHDLDQVMI